MKKLAIGFGVVVGVVLVILALLPFFIDVDKFRPQVKAMIEQNLNADAEIGKLSLKVWGGLNIGIESLAIYEKNSKAQPVFAMNDAKVDLALMPLLSRQIIATLKVDNPDINIVKGRDGSLNVMRLLKPSEKGAPSATQQGEQNSGGAAQGLAAGADISVELKDGKVTYVDLLKGTKTSLTGIGLSLYHIGLNKPVDVRFNSTLDVKGIKDLTLSGKADLKGTVAAFVNAGEGFERFTADLDLDATDLIVKYGVLFNKSDKVPLKVQTKLQATPTSLRFDKLHTELNGLAVDVTGTVEDFEAPILNLNIKSTNFVLQDWKNVIGMLKGYSAHGAANFDVKVTGATTDIKINGELKTKDISLKLAALRQPITNLNADLRFTEDTANLKTFSLMLGKSDLTAKGTVKNFNKPSIDVQLTSKLLDLDAILPQKTPEQIKAEEEAAARGEQKELTDEQMEQMASGPIDAIRKNSYLRGMNFTSAANVTKVRYSKTDLTDVRAVVAFADLVLALKEMRAKVFDGQASGSATVDFKPRDIIYNLTGVVESVDINKAITSQMPSLKDTVTGKTFGKFDIGGSGVTKTKAKSTLAGKGNFRLDGGSWSALKALQQIGEKVSNIPGAKEKIANIQVSGKIRKATSDFTISGGKFNILNLIADLEEANTGLTGQGFVDFDKNLMLAGKLLLPGTVHSAFRTPDGRSAIPYEVGCKANAPCIKAEVTLKPLAEAFAKDEVKKVAEKGLEKLKESVKDERAKKLLEQVDKKKLEEALKKFKF